MKANLFSWKQQPLLQNEWLEKWSDHRRPDRKTLNITQAGTYTIKATGNVGGGSECTVEETATVVVNPKLAVSVTGIQPHARAE